MKRVFLRCNGGHYFCGMVSCPFDGWATEELAGLREAVARLGGEDGVTIDALRKEGVSGTLMSRIIIMEFGVDASAAFDGVAPSHYVISDKLTDVDEVELNLM